MSVLDLAVQFWVSKVSRRRLRTKPFGELVLGVWMLKVLLTIYLWSTSEKIQDQVAERFCEAQHVKLIHQLLENDGNEG